MRRYCRKRHPGEARMRKRRIGIIDLVSKGPTRALYARVMTANLASIMTQVIAVWCEQAGHDVTFVCYTGFEHLVEELPDNVDLVFIGAFTEAAHFVSSRRRHTRLQGDWSSDVCSSD